MTTILNKKIDISSLLKAQAVLHDAIKVAKSDLEKAGAVQAFEFCYELAWKTMKRILAVRGIEVFSPKETFRQAGQEHLIDNSETWFTYVALRNITVHTYSHDVLKKVFLELPGFATILDKFITDIQRL